MEQKYDDDDEDDKDENDNDDDNELLLSKLRSADDQDG